MAVYFGVQIVPWVYQSNRINGKIDNLEIEKEKEIYAAKIEFSPVNPRNQNSFDVDQKHSEDLLKKAFENNALYTQAYRWLKKIRMNC